jgi:hypothetical protein
MVTFENMPEMFDAFGEPCNNCTRYPDGLICDLGHRQKVVRIASGHIPEVTVRKRGGCADHLLKEGDWWNEDPVKRHQSGYGGSSTNLLF